MIWRAVLAALLLVCFTEIGAAADLTCAEAAASAETEAAIPHGLLLAIGLVESGRTNAAGQRAPWPWAVQSGGTGQFFASVDEAVAAVDQIRAGGVQSIDIGCFQINLFYHPTAFADPASGFNPLKNARAAARFLIELHGELGTWEQAVAAYHSRTGELGSAYREKVYAAWSQPADASLEPPDTQHPPRTQVAVYFGVHVWGPAGRLNTYASALRLPRIITPAFH